MTRVKFFFLKLLAWLPFGWLRQKLACQLLRAIEGTLTDTTLEIMLWGMSLAYMLPCFRRNVAGFSAKYLFRTANDTVAVGAIFDNGHMRVVHNKFEDYDVAVTFADPAAIWRFLLLRDHDILASLLANEVSVDRNLNYILKFGFMVRELMHRLNLGDLLEKRVPELADQLKRRLSVA